MSDFDATGSELSTYCRALSAHIEDFVHQHWDWQHLALKQFEKLNAGLLALAWQQADPSAKRIVTLPPGTGDESLVDWTRVAALDAYLRTQKAGVATATSLPATFKEGDLVYCDAPNGNGWVAEVRQPVGLRLRVRGLLDDRREAEAQVCRRVLHFPYADKNLLGEYFSLKFLEWQRRIGRGLADGRRLLRQPQGFVQPTGATAVIVTNTSAKALERLFEELPFLPAAYGIETRDVCLALPFVPRIFLADDVAAARKLVKQLRQKNPRATPSHLYVVGTPRYRKYWDELPNECAQDDWASVTLLGTETDESAPAAYVPWRWTSEELNYFFDRTQASGAGRVRLKLTAERPLQPFAEAAAPSIDAVARLRQLVIGVQAPLHALAESMPPVHPRPVYHLLNAYLRYILPPGRECHRAAEWLRRQQERVKAYLGGPEAEDDDTGQEQFASAFHEAGIFAPSRIGQAATELQAAFQALHDFFQTESPKHRHLTSSLKKSWRDNPTGGRYVLADRDSYAEARATYHDPERRVSVLRLYDNTGAVPSSQRIMRDATLNAEDARFLVPFLFNREQYDTMCRARGQVKLFLYEELEEGKFDNVQRATERRDEARLLAGGRAQLCGLSYPQLVAQAAPVSEAAAATSPFGPERQYDFFARLYALDEISYGREVQDRVVESRPCLVRFAGGETAVLESSKNVLREEPGGYVRRPVSELVAGDAILFYENEDRDLNYKILLAQDKSGVMQRIEHYSKLWRRTLRRLERGCANENLLFHKLKRHGFPVAILSLRQYLNGTIRFPQHEATLRAIQQLAREEALSDCDLLRDEELRALLVHRARYQSLAHSLGRGLSDELLRYHVTRQRGSLLSALDAPIVEALSRSIKQHRVQSVQPWSRA